MPLRGISDSYDVFHFSHTSTGRWLTQPGHENDTTSAGDMHLSATLIVKASVITSVAFMT
jgi:hypothetical protein